MSNKRGIHKYGRLYQTMKKKISEAPIPRKNIKRRVVNGRLKGLKLFSLSICCISGLDILKMLPKKSNFWRKESMGGIRIRKTPLKPINLFVTKSGCMLFSLLLCKMKYSICTSFRACLKKLSQKCQSLGHLFRTRYQHLMLLYTLMAATVPLGLITPVLPSYIRGIVLLFYCIIFSPFLF